LKEFISTGENENDGEIAAEAGNNVGETGACEWEGCLAWFRLFK